MLSLRDIEVNEPIDIALMFLSPNYFEISNNFGKYINHKSYPDDNSHLSKRGNKWVLVSSRKIIKNEEIVLDYDKLPPFLKRSEKHFK